MSQTPEYIYSEGPAIELFQRLGYQYFNAAQHDEREDISEVILKNKLLDAIRRINPWINENNLHKAFEKLTTVQGTSLMEVNQKVWELLKGPVYVVKQVINGQEEHRPVSFIDYQNPANNDFLLVSQMKYRNRVGRNSLPDLVVYLNGLPVAVIECKSPVAHTAWDKAYGDLNEYQDLNEKLFHYNQVCAGIWQVGGRYGAIGAPQAYYSVFRTKEVAALTELLEREPNEQDRLIYNLFRPEQFLDIIRHFVIFELDEGRTIKKLPRYQQIRATNRTIEKLQKG